MYLGVPSPHILVATAMVKREVMVIRQNHHQTIGKSSHLQDSVTARLNPRTGDHNLKELIF